MCVVVLGGRVRCTVPDIFVAKSVFFTIQWCGTINEASYEDHCFASYHRSYLFSASLWHIWARKIVNPVAHFLRFGWVNGALLLPAPPAAIVFIELAEPLLFFIRLVQVYQTKTPIEHLPGTPLWGKLCLWSASPRESGIATVAGSNCLLEVCEGRARCCLPQRLACLRWLLPFKNAARGWIEQQIKRNPTAARDREKGGHVRNKVFQEKLISRRPAFYAIASRPSLTRHLYNCASRFSSRSRNCTANLSPCSQATVAFKVKGDSVSCSW